MRAKNEYAFSPVRGGASIRRSRNRGGKPKPKLQLVSFKPMRRNALVGFAVIRFVSGLKLNDCPVHLHPNGRVWVSLPGKPVIDEDGRQKRDAKGKPAYVPVAEWSDRATSAELVIGLLRERFPDALDAAEPKWKSSDRRWFEENPNRSYRLRKPLPGEWQGLPNSSFPKKEGLLRVVVWQLFRGFRMRGVQLRRPLTDDEDTTRRLFDEILPRISLSGDKTKYFIARLHAGDNCHGCGREFASGEPSLAGFSRKNDDPINVGLCCVHQLGALVAISLYLAGRDVPAAVLAKLPTQGHA
jgi:hypothetical protein